MGKRIKIKLETGTVYQKEEGGTYYYRYQVNSECKCVSLKTTNQIHQLFRHYMNEIVSANPEQQKDILWTISNRKTFQYAVATK